MTLADLGSLGEFVGSIAVVVTLILLLLELRTNTKTLESNASSELAGQMAAWHGRAANNTDILRVFDLGISNSLVDPIDVARFKWFAAEYLLLCQSAYFRHQRGQLTDETWESYLAAVLGFLDVEVMIDSWEKNEVAYSQSYRDYINQALSSNRARHKLSVPGQINSQNTAGA